MRETTLYYIENAGCVLMLHRTKKEIDPNKGKWIGIGGGIEAGETAEQCLLREVQEESGLVLTSYKKRGIISFISDVYEHERMHLYTADGYIGVLSDCDEGELHWIEWERVLQLNLWEGDRVFFKLLMQDAAYFDLELSYAGDQLVRAVLNGKGIDV